MNAGASEGASLTDTKTLGARSDFEKRFNTKKRDMSVSKAAKLLVSTTRSVFQQVHITAVNVICTSGRYKNSFATSICTQHCYCDIYSSRHFRIDCQSY